MDRPQRQPESGGQAMERGGAQSVGHDGFPGQHGSAAGEGGSGHAPVLPQQPGSAAAEDPAVAVRGQEFPDPGEQPAGVHLVVGGNVEGAGDAGAQQGFAGARLPDGQRLDGQAGRLLDGAQVRERPAVGGVGAHGEGRRREVARAVGSAGDSAGVRPGARVLEPGGECGPEA